VKAGELTEKGAEAMMEGLKKRADMYRKGEDKEYDAVIARIRAAVADGKHVTTGLVIQKFCTISKSSIPLT